MCWRCVCKKIRHMDSSRGRPSDLLSERCAKAAVQPKCKKYRHTWPNQRIACQILRSCNNLELDKTVKISVISASLYPKSTNSRVSSMVSSRHHLCACKTAAILLNRLSHGVNLPRRSAIHPIPRFAPAAADIGSCARFRPFGCLWVKESSRSTRDIRSHASALSGRSRSGRSRGTSAPRSRRSGDDAKPSSDSSVVK